MLHCPRNVYFPVFLPGGPVWAGTVPLVCTTNRMYRRRNFPYWFACGNSCFRDRTWHILGLLPFMWGDFWYYDQHFQDMSNIWFKIWSTFAPTLTLPVFARSCGVFRQTGYNPDWEKWQNKHCVHVIIMSAIRCYPPLFSKLLFWLTVSV